MTQQEYDFQKYELSAYGQGLVGRTAQSRILTEIGSKGGKVISPAQKITGYEVVEVFQEPVLMVTIGGESVYEDTLFNISKPKSSAP